MLGREIARAFRPEIKSNRRGAGFDGRIRVFLVGDAADFQDHDATNEANAAAGSADFMRCSPTRNAVNPAARRRAMSAALWIPLSLTRTASSGMWGASWSEVSSETEKVVRSRLLTPMMVLPAATALS